MQVLSKARLRLYNVDEPLRLHGVRGLHEVNVILRGSVSLSSPAGIVAIAGEPEPTRTISQDDMLPALSSRCYQTC